MLADTRPLSRARVWLGSDRGSAPLEFLFFGVLLMVPLVYLVIATMNLQLASFASESAARTLARAHTLDPNLAIDSGQTLAVLLADYGFSPKDLAYTVNINQELAQVEVGVRLRVGLPLLGGFMGDFAIMSSRVVMPVSRYL